MTLTNKILILIFAICTLGAGAFIIYKQMEISDRQKNIEQSVMKQKELGEGLMRSMSQYATPGQIEQIIKDNQLDLSKITKELDSLRSKVDSINVVVTRTEGKIWENSGSTGSRPATPDPGTTEKVKCDGKEIDCLKDPNGYFTSTQTYDLTEEFRDVKVPFGTVEFTASHKKPWGGKILPREYKLATVSGIDEDRRITNVNKFTIKVGDKDYVIPITQAETSQVYPEAKFRWWSPRLYIGADAGLSINLLSFLFDPSLNFAIANYGQYVQNPDFSILQVGAGIGVPDKKLYFILTPLAYNVGKHIPFMLSTYIGPSVQISTSSDIAVMLGLRVGL